MELKTLSIIDFRGIAELEISFHPRTNVFVGINGSGKSAILDCLAIMLSRLVGRIRSTSGTGRFYSTHDITNGRSQTKNEIEVLVDDESVGWYFTKTRSGRRKGQFISNFDQLKRIAGQIQSEIESDSKASLPLAVYYPVNRAVLDIPLRIRRRHEFDRLSAYDQALTGARNDFRIFFEWFRGREDLENETRLRPRKRKYRDRQLQAVRRAIEGLLPDFEDLRVQRSPLRMTLLKDEEELIVDQLSDGEKCLLAMTGDLARRLAIANPSLTDPLKGKAVVLIDEIDLHLHPSWQRDVIGCLTRVFPNCQFVLTTHSPQVVSEVPSECIMSLQRSEHDVRIVRPDSAYGLDTNRILEDIMAVSERPQLVKTALRRLFRAIEDGNIEAATDRLEKLRGKIGSDPELAKADAMIRRKEILAR
ncbi:MAG: AAA family ATPase [Candidatus Nealsonbacteria bacterium]|nr:AAA family ATPase [Candidatus Nealsonbacteria bacterium]